MKTLFKILLPPLLFSSIPAIALELKLVPASSSEPPPSKLLGHEENVDNWLREHQWIETTNDSGTFLYIDIPTNPIIMDAPDDYTTPVPFEPIGPLIILD